MKNNTDSIRTRILNATTNDELTALETELTTFKFASEKTKRRAIKALKVRSAALNA